MVREISLQTTILVLAAGLLAFGGLGDLRNRRIPNVLCLVIAALGLARLILAGDPIAAGYTLGAGGAIFVAAFILVACGAVGGGDAKLLGAAALLVGYRGLVDFLFLMSLCGAVLGAIAIGRALVWAKFSPWLDYAKIVASFSWTRLASINDTQGRLGSWLHQDPTNAGRVGSGEAKPTRLTVPYGVAIAVAGIITLTLQTNPIR
jgi:Flp pilus assembly protein protease CpaA